MIMSIRNKILLSFCAVSMATGNATQLVAAEEQSVIVRNSQKIERDIPEMNTPGAFWGQTTEKAFTLYASKCYWISRCYRRHDSGKTCVSTILIPDAVKEKDSTERTAVTPRHLQRAAEYFSRTAVPTGGIVTQEVGAIPGLYSNESLGRDIEPAYAVPSESWKDDREPLSYDDIQKMKQVAEVFSYLGVKPKELSAEDMKPERLKELETLLHSHISPQYNGSNVIVSSEDRLENSEWAFWVKRDKKAPAATILGQCVTQNEVIACCSLNDVPAQTSTDKGS